MSKTCRSYFQNLALLFTVMLMTFGGEVKGQRVYASSTGYISPNGMSSLLGCGGGLNLNPCYTTLSVENPGNSLTSNNTTFARVKSGSGLALNIGAYQGEIELVFGTTLDSGVTSYIRINNNTPNLLNSLLGGSLGNLLSSVLGGVVLGDHYFETGARMGTQDATGTSEISKNGFSNSRIKLIKDANGYFYIAITPNKKYDRVYLKDFTNAAVGLNTTNYTDVYYAFYGNAPDPCAQGFFTSYDGTGISLSLLQLGTAGVTNAEYVIDADTTNFSTLALGLLGVSSSISQHIYFENLSMPGDEFNVKLKLAPSLINVGLLNKITVTAYNGITPVYNSTINDALNIQLLGLLNTGLPATIPFSPTLPFNRVTVTVSGTLNVSISQAINLYGVIRTPAKPTLTAPDVNVATICSGSSAVLTATTSNTNQLIWYENISGGPALEIVAYNGTYTTPILTSAKTYYVAVKKIGCLAISARVPVNVIVNPLPSISLTLPPPVCGSRSSFNLNYTNPLNTPTTYSINWDSNAGTAGWIDENSPKPLPANGTIQIIVPTNISPNIYHGTLRVYNTTCSKDIPIDITIYQSPPSPTISLSN